MTPNWSAPVAGVDELTERKLEAFDRLEQSFEASFAYLREMHGERRFAAVPVERSVAYLHALWVCECKDWLLSVPKTIARYEGGASLQALRAWQQGDEVTVIAFIERKLDGLNFAMLSRRLREARDAGDTAQTERLTHGRTILLNRAYNLNAALDAIFAATPEEAARQVSEASARFGHNPEEIERQLADFKTPLYSYTPHPALVRRNMQVMNRLGARGAENEADRPGERTPNVEAPTLPFAPYAQEAIVNEHTLSSMADNNPAHLHLAMPPLDLDDGQATPPNQS
jgi:hypothetical protein